MEAIREGQVDDARGRGDRLLEQYLQQVRECVIWCTEGGDGFTRGWDSLSAVAKEKTEQLGTDAGSEGKYRSWGSWKFSSMCFLMFIFERERERLGEGQREGETESEASSRLRAVNTELDMGLEPTDCMIMT